MCSQTRLTLQLSIWGTFFCIRSRQFTINRHCSHIGSILVSCNKCALYFSSQSLKMWCCYQQCHLVALFRISRWAGPELRIADCSWTGRNLRDVCVARQMSRKTQWVLGIKLDVISHVHTRARSISPAMSHSCSRTTVLWSQLITLRAKSTPMVAR